MAPSDAVPDQAEWRRPRPTVQRAIGAVVLLAAGILSLPLAAGFLDGEGTEDWIFPVQLVAMAVIGGAVGLALPALASADATTVKRATTGAGWGLLAAAVGIAVFWLLLSGFDGA